MKIGLNQNIWGPGTWLYLHSVTFNFDDNPSPQDKENIRQFFGNFGKTLPCKFCRQNFAKHTTKHPINLDSRVELVKWLIDIHNMVNKQEGKRVISYREAVGIYEKLYKKDLNLDELKNSTDYISPYTPMTSLLPSPSDILNCKYKKGIIYMLVILVLLLLLYILFKGKKKRR